MNEKITSNKIENDQFNFNSEISDYSVLVTKLKEIGTIISSLEKNNITATIRMSRGNDIDAACGQLANK